MSFWRALAARSTPFQGRARTWHARYSWEGWKAIPSSVLVMTGVLTFEQGGSSMLRNLASLSTPQSSRRENCSLASVERKGHEKSQFVHPLNLSLVPEGEAVFHRAQHPVRLRRLRSC